MGNPAVKMGAICFALLIKALQQKPCTLADLAEATGLFVRTIGRYVQALHKEEVVWISGWKEDALGREQIAVYSLGMGVDVKPRPAKSSTQLMREYRARVAARETSPQEKTLPSSSKSRPNVANSVFSPLLASSLKKRKHRSLKSAGAKGTTSSATRAA